MPLPSSPPPSPSPAASGRERFIGKLLRRPRRVIACWVVAVAVAVPPALQLGRVAQGGSEAIRGSESHTVMELGNQAFGAGSPHPVELVVTSADLYTSDPRFGEIIERLGVHLTGDPLIRRVTHAWSAGQPELLGRDGHSALLFVQSADATLIAVENFTGTVRARLADAGLPPGFQAHVTGMSSMFYDLNRRSSADLLRAEAVGIPLTLLVLYLVFRTARAAGLALAVAGVAVTLSSAFLRLANPWLPASLLAQNVVTMIGLGAGTDYALFLLSHLREERRRGRVGDAAVAGALRTAGPAIVAAGAAVAGGFAALFLVNARFVHSLALGGVAVIAVAVAATLTLLPALLAVGGDRVFPRHAIPAGPETAPDGVWERWAHLVMRRPWAGLLLAVLVAGLWAWPAVLTEPWRISPRDLPPAEESRRGFEILAREFEPGWMGPIVVSLEGRPGATLWAPAGQQAALAVAAELRREPLIAHLSGYARLLEWLGPVRETTRAVHALPAELAEAARGTISADGRVAQLIAVPRVHPEHEDAVALIRKLRSRRWPAAEAAGITVRIGGGPAIIHDFDAEMFRSVGRVMAAVIGLTFGLLLGFFRSIAVPVKAIAANLLSVGAAYGFLVLVFQFGFGARLLGIAPPGGLNSFVVLMLFTILFGLSMDYEIFLLSRVRDEYRRSGDNAGSVAAGLAATAGVISGAAAVMVCLFGSFGFFGLTASRQFGLGLAFAVAFDATVVRLLIVPAAMRLLGRWNWWLPGGAGRAAGRGRPD